MNPENPEQPGPAPSPSGRPTIDAERILDELRLFSAAIYWRDTCEVGVCLLMVPLWFILGASLALPWTWYLTVPALLWIAGSLLVGRIRQGRQAPGPGEPLRELVAASMGQVEHQIWLLRHIFWWYLLPLALSILAFFGQVTWQARSGGWPTALLGAGMVVIVAVVFAVIYRLNQDAVRSKLEPRRRELEALLLSLGGETA